MASFTSSYSRMSKYFFLIAAFLFPFTTFAALQDLEVRTQDILFSKEQVVAGDHVRLYVKIHNVGTEDISGFVSFFQGTVPVGNSQVISSVAGGAPDEVYVDFVVPASDFNIRAEIQGTDPADQNDNNNTAITQMFHPIIDDDRDGIENTSDNCPQASNPNQLDSDSDTLGDACDDDDDNDGLSDSVENELGSNPLAKDSDNDGVADPNDAFPTDATKTSHEVPKSKPTPTPQPKLEPTPEPAAEPEQIATAPSDEPSPITAILNKVADQVSQQFEDGEADQKDANLAASTNAVFTFERLKWNEFDFRILGPEREGHVYEWNFGDGTTSSRTQATHTYEKSGSYKVTLTIHTPDGARATETAEMDVPFFSLQNPPVLAMVTVLFLLLLATLMLTRRMRTGVLFTKDDEEDDEEGDGDDEYDPPEFSCKKKIFVKEE